MIYNYWTRFNEICRRNDNMWPGVTNDKVKTKWKD